MKKLTLILTLLVPVFLLSQPCLPLGITFTTQAEIDNFQTNYPNCSRIIGDVLIGIEYGHTEINNLLGLGALTSIGGDFTISNNNNLTSLTGLNNLDSIEGNLSIEGWNPLTDLNGLGSLKYIGKDLLIWNAEKLINFEGINNLSTIKRNIHIRLNDSLTSFKGLEKIDSIHGNVTVWVNNSLINFEGFDNLTFIGGNVQIGACLVNPDCDGNDYLLSLTGLNKLSTINGYLSIIGNGKLKSMNGLENLESVGGLGIGYYAVSKYGGNRSLTDLSSLSNLVSVGGSLGIKGNKALNSLKGLDNIDANTINNLSIYSNNLLSTCEVKAICDYLASPDAVVNIHDNASGCSNQEEVEEACGDPGFINNMTLVSDLTIYPNPFPNSTTIEYELYHSTKVQLIVYDYLGNQVEVIEKNQSQGKQQIIWNAERLPAGIYFCVLNINEKIITTKMIKE